MWSLLGSAVSAIGGTAIGLYENSQANNAIQGGIQAVENTDSQIAGDAANTAAQGGVGPGANYLRNMIADPGTLTAAQQSQLADLRTSTANQLHGSDFAGNGRTAAAVFGKTEDSFTNDALTSNRQQAIGAANTLSSNSNLAQGREFSAEQGGANAALQGAQSTASNDIATGKLIGGAIGDIGSSAAQASKLQALS